MRGAVGFTFNAVPSENGEADVTVVVAVDPKERFNGTFDAALLPRENPK